ncbi:type III polyketide synthase [Edaphobacter sp. 12200R-103]|uniref:type III polyketide synthase n=1 Tax=Edaphobacter sp. 12200R-103 TaxID=2703788 RepID=UPI001EE4BF68|nr:type III polyketide synthase [Edaphobacter sp. 12200R-103]
MNKSSSYSLPAKCYQKDRDLVSKQVTVVFRIWSLFSQVADHRRIVASSWFSFSRADATLIFTIRAKDLLHMTTAFLNRIATAVPKYDVHDTFVVFAEKMLTDPRLSTIFRRMASRADIVHRYSFLDPRNDSGQISSHYAHEFYRTGNFPNTARRMEMFEQNAPRLMKKVVNQLALSEDERSGITHVLVTCCTGFYAPGLDFEIVDHLGLSADVERTMVGFMGCYAAINALKLARHIVRSDPKAGVLMVNLELCTLHFQETQELDQMLSFLIFADGAAASLISAREQGFALDSFKAVTVPETKGLITWKIGDLGFDMFLSGKVPLDLSRSLHGGELKDERDGIDLWAVHPGGRSILDAVERGLELPADALAASREVLSAFGNMSSATVMFVLQRIMQHARPGQRGCAMAFGPGLTAETMRFHAV